MTSTAIQPPPASPRTGRPRDGASAKPLRVRLAQPISKLMVGICCAFTAFILLVLACVTGYLLLLGAGSLSIDFFTKVPTGDVANPGGMLHGIVGTLMLTGMASLVGIPLGVLAGIYLSEYGAGTRLATVIRFVADVLAGVPSIVVGILGYELLVVPLGRYNGYAGAFAMAFIMIPIVTRTTEEMLLLVPRSYREASIALGASKAKTILQVVLPAATGSVITGVMLAIARVAGETAPLLFTTLGSRFLTTNPSEPFPSLTVQIYQYATGPYPEQKRLAWAGILVLISMIFVINVLIRTAVRKR
jgi:phosphate transport system permease protein